MEFVNGKDDIPYMQWKIKHVPVTTNQDQKGALEPPGAISDG